MVKKLTEADGAVRGIGAANTVVFDGKKRLRLQHRLPRGHGQPGRGRRATATKPQRRNLLRGKTALVLGAGGVGKAIVYGLVRRGRHRWSSATASPGRRSRWPNDFDCRSVEWAARHSVSADLLFNCTPVGMHPNVDETPFEKHHLRPSMIVFDAVYNPENTLLVKEARSRNCTVVTGVDMFVRQACLQFKLFTGQEGPADLMRETIRRAIGAAKY